MLRFSPSFLLDMGGGASPLIKCERARELIGQNREPTEEEARLLRRHLELCPRCAAEAVVERAIREVVAPAEMPTPSDDFEMALMAKLDLDPAVEGAYNHKLDDSPAITLGWIAAAASVVGLLLWRLDDVANAVRGAGAMAYAQIAGLFDGQVAVCLGSLTDSVPSGALLHGNLAPHLILAALTLGGGLAAIRWATGE